MTQSKNIFLTYKGETLNLVQWAERYEQNVKTVRTRYNKYEQAMLQAEGEEKNQLIETVITGAKTAASEANTPKESKESKSSNNRASNLLNLIDEVFVKTLAQTSVDQIWEDVSPQLEQKMLETYGFIPHVHEVKLPEKTTKFDGITHEKFDQVLQLVSLDIPVFLSGPAGTGKNVICQQVAKALGLDFYFSNAVTQEFKLTGFVDANGNYQDTQFYNAFTKGGLFFLDEMDASVPEVLVILNAAIANRYFDFPKEGRLEAHPNFRVIAAGNTIGTGADNEYTGRFCLDRASLDRFALIDINYSPQIESEVTNGNKELIKFAHIFRAVCDKSGIQCIFSYRSMQRIAILEKLTGDLPEVLKISLIKGLAKDDIRIIGNGLKEIIPDNEYYKALTLLYD